MKRNEIKVKSLDHSKGNNRRKFLKLSGMALAGSGLLLACSSDDDAMLPPDPDPDPDPDPEDPQVFDLGKGDVGVLNYAYALEQLEADFYNRVVNHSNFRSTFNEMEQQIMVDLYNHEVIHRDFFNTAISDAVNNDSALVLPELEFNFDGLDFGDRMAVLQTSIALEDTGVAAYNGAGRLLTSPTYLLIAGKIVSVEARHASAVRDLLNPGSADFAGNDIVDPDNGLGRAFAPEDTVNAAGEFIVTPFTWMEQGLEG